MQNTYWLAPIAGLGLALLSGCASMTNDPHLKDKLTHLDTADLDDQAESERLSFLARYMMEAMTVPSWKQILPTLSTCNNSLPPKPVC